MTSKRFQALLFAAACGALPASARAQAEHVIVVPGFADFLAPDGDSVWATNKGKVERWSRAGKLAEVALARPCGGMAMLDGALWVANCADGTLNRIDTATGKLVATIPTGIANQKEGELNVVAGAGSVWLASDATGVVSRVDPTTNAVIASIKVDPATSYMTYGYGAAWAVSLLQGTLQKIDPTSNAVVARTKLGKAPGFLAAGEGAVWVQEQGDGTVARVDPSTAAVTGRIKVGAVLKYGDIDTGGGMVWLRTTEDQTYVAIDARTLEIRARVGKADGSGALRFTEKGLWTSAHDVHTLTWWPEPIPAPE